MMISVEEPVIPGTWAKADEMKFIDWKLHNGAEGPHEVEKRADYSWRGPESNGATPLRRGPRFAYAGRGFRR
jgi:hypothetical protein